MVAWTVRMTAKNKVVLMTGQITDSPGLGTLQNLMYWVERAISKFVDDGSEAISFHFLTPKRTRSGLEGPAVPILCGLSTPLFADHVAGQFCIWVTQLFFIGGHIERSASPGVPLKL